MSAFTTKHSDCRTKGFDHMRIIAAASIAFVLALASAIGAREPAASSAAQDANAATDEAKRR